MDNAPEYFNGLFQPSNNYIAPDNSDAFDKYFEIVKPLEGTVYENDPNDSGGCTKYGLTADDLREYYKDRTKNCNDVKNIDNDEAYSVMKKLYWDFFRADLIPNVSLAMFIVDGGLNQGRVTITNFLQKIVGINPTTGHFGDKTFGGIINMDSSTVFSNLYQLRLTRYNNIVSKYPKNARYLKGWINRLNAIKYQN